MSINEAAKAIADEFYCDRSEFQGALKKFLEMIKFEVVKTNDENAKSIENIDTTRLFELAITFYAEKCITDSEAIERLKSELSIEKLIEKSKNPSSNYDEQYACYFILSIIYRRQINILTLENHINSLKDYFKKYPSIIILQTDLARESILTKENTPRLLNKLRETMENVYVTAGILSCYADLVVEAIDRKIIMGNEDIDRAIECITKAINLDEKYAKYYYILGKLLTCRGEYENARSNIRKAIGIEVQRLLDNSNKPNNSAYYNSNLRRSQFELFLTKIDVIEAETSLERRTKELHTLIRENSDKFDKQSKENSTYVDKRLKEGLVDNIKILSLFMAVFSFISLTINIIPAQSKFLFSAALVIMSLGAMIIYFCLLSIFFNTKGENFDKTDFKIKLLIKHFKLEFFLFIVGLLVLICGVLIGIVGVKP